MKAKVFKTSLETHHRNLHSFVVRHHKYLRAVTPYTNKDRSLNPSLIPNVLKTLKKVKTLQSWSLNDTFFEPTDTKSYIFQEVIKSHCNSIKKLKILVQNQHLPQEYDRLMRKLKHLIKVAISTTQSNLTSLTKLMGLQVLFIKLESNEIEKFRLNAILRRLPNLNTVYFMCSTVYCGEVFLFLDTLHDLVKDSVRFQIIANDDCGYLQFPAFKDRVLNRLKHIQLEEIDDTSVFDSLLGCNRSLFTNLNSLKLGLSAPDLAAAAYLEHLQDLKQLEKLTLTFDECWTSEFSLKVLNSLRLPSSLKRFSMSTGISFQELIMKNSEMLDQTNLNLPKTYPWRKANLFEEDASSCSFFKAFETANQLEKVKLKFQLLEEFESFETNFFVSLAKRLPNIAFLVIHVTNCSIPDLAGPQEEVEQGFDLSIFLDVCSKMPSLQELEILMPKFLFNDIKLETGFNKLHGFVIGVLESNQSNLKRYSDMSKGLECFLKSLQREAPGLRSLVLDFPEVYKDEASFVRRFSLIQNFQKLENLCVTFSIPECSAETAEDIGRILSSLKQLNMVLITFLEQNRNLRRIERYIRYLRSIKYFFIGLNKMIGLHADL